MLKVCVDEDMKKSEPCALLVGRQNGAAAVQNSLAAAQKVKRRITISSGNSTSRYIPRRTEIRVSNRHLKTMLTAALLAEAKRWKLRKCPLMGTWVSRVWYIRTMKHFQPQKEMKF